MDFYAKCLTLLILELQTSSLLHPSDAIHASLTIGYIQDGIQDGSRQVLQTCGGGNLTVRMSDGFVTDQIPCLVDKHFTYTCIWVI